MRTITLAAIMAAAAAEIFTPQDALDYIFIDYDGYIAFLESVDEDYYLDEDEMAHADSQWSLFESLLNDGDDYSESTWVCWLTDTLSSTSANNMGGQSLTFEELNAFV